jgi:hypothetical protein
MSKIILKKIIPLILLLSGYFSAHSQITKLQPSFTAIIVANIDSSVTWYINTFNLTLRNRVDNSERGYKQAILISKLTMIELVELKKGIGRDSLLNKFPQGTQLHGLNKFGFTVPDIDALQKELTQKNVTFLGRMVTDQVSNKRTFLIVDPDKNMLQFFEQ